METGGRWVWAATSYGGGRGDEELDTCATSYASRVEALEAAKRDLGWVPTRWEVWYEQDARGCYHALLEDNGYVDNLGRLDVWLVS